jgi:hypothetical protein
VRRWARYSLAAIAVAAGAGIVLVAWAAEALAEDGDDPQDTTLLVVLGLATIAFGVATCFTAWAALGAAGMLASVFLLAYSGEIPDDVAYEFVTGPALLLFGAVAFVSRRGGRGTRAAPRASAEAPTPPVPSEAPSAAGEEQPRRTPPS